MARLHLKLPHLDSADSSFYQLQFFLRDLEYYFSLNGIEEDSDKMKLLSLSLNNQAKSILFHTANDQTTFNQAVVILKQL